MVGLIQVWFFQVGAMKEQMDKKKIEQSQKSGEMDYKI